MMPEWISVEERFPDLPDNRLYASKMVIACYRKFDGTLGVGARWYERSTNRGKVVYRWKYPWDRISDEDIVYWQPLPEPPNED